MFTCQLVNVWYEDAKIVFAIHALVGVVEGLGVGKPSFLLVEDVGLGG